MHKISVSAGAAVRMYSLAAAAALRATPAAALRAAPAAALRAAPAASALRASHPPHVGLDKPRNWLGLDSNNRNPAKLEWAVRRGGGVHHQQRLLRSPLTGHQSLVTSHWSPVTAHRSSRTAHYALALCTAHCAPCTAHRTTLTWTPGNQTRHVRDRDRTAWEHNRPATAA